MSESVAKLRAAVIGLLGQAEEYREEIGECDHEVEQTISEAKGLK